MLSGRAADVGGKNRGPGWLLSPPRQLPHIVPGKNYLWVPSLSLQLLSILVDYHTTSLFCHCERLQMSPNSDSMSPAPDSPAREPCTESGSQGQWEHRSHHIAYLTVFTLPGSPSLPEPAKLRPGASSCSQRCAYCSGYHRLPARAVVVQVLIQRGQSSEWLSRGMARYLISFINLTG